MPTQVREAALATLVGKTIASTRIVELDHQVHQITLRFTDGTALAVHNRPQPTAAADAAAS